MSVSKFFAKSTSAISNSGGASSAAAFGGRTTQDPVNSQVEKKLRKLERYKSLTGSELQYEVEKLSTTEGLLNELSHIVDHTIIPRDGASQTGTAFQIASIHIQIMVRDSVASLGAQVAVTRSMAEFMSMNYNKKHVVLKLNDVVLVWGEEDLVIPLRVEEYEALIGLLPVVETVKHFFYCTSVSEDSPIFGGVAKVISKYNKAYYYSSPKRNSQKFVCDVLEALGISAKTCSSPPISERMLQLKEKKSGDVPDSFARHEDVDVFIMTKSKSWLAYLQTDSLEYLRLVYKQFHGEKTVCSVPNCRVFVLSELLQQRSMLL